MQSFLTLYPRTQLEEMDYDFEGSVNDHVNDDGTDQLQIEGTQANENDVSDVPDVVNVDEGVTVV